MELAQDATRVPLIDYAPALPPPACIAWSVFPPSNICTRFRRCAAAHACRDVHSAVEDATGRLEGSFDTGCSGSYSNRLSPRDGCWVRHGVMRLDWGADPHQVLEFCAGHQGSYAIADWLRGMGAIAGWLQLRGFGRILGALPCVLRRSATAGCRVLRWRTRQLV